MEQRFQTPAQHAESWCLAMSAASHVDLARVEVPGLGPVILKADGEGGWWALAANCQRCGGEIASAPTAAPGAGTVVTCTACGAAHGPHEPGCVCIATLVVDDEVYLLRDA